MASNASNESEVKEPENEEVDLGFPLTDVTLVVEDRKIYVNKDILSEHSPVFNTMFKGQFKESTAEEIILQGKRAADFVKFLKCFYPNMKDPISGENVLQVLPLAHEYQSPLVADCEDFMIAMCKPNIGLTVSTLLDYILAGEKYGLTKFLEAAVEFCAHVDFELLNGNTFARSGSYSRGVYKKLIDKNIFLKFSKIEFKTQFAIAKRRVQQLEMNWKKRECSDELQNDYTIQLS